MNVLFICDEYPPGNNGGIGTTVQNLGRELVKNGHNVFVAGLYAYRYKQKNYEEDEGVKIYRSRYGINLHLPSKNKLYTLLERLPDFVKKNLNGKRAFEKYIKFINELIVSESIDIIEIADFNNFAMYIGFTINWPTFKVPLVLKSHGSYTYFCNELGEKPQAKFVLNDKILYERGDAFSSVSHYTANANKRLFNINSDIKVLYNGVQIPDKVKRHENAKETVVFTGTLVYKKGIFSLIKAWNNLIKTRPGAELLIFGKGNTDKLSDLLTAEAKKTVKFMGHVDRKVLVDHLCEASLAIFPSYSETFGMGVVEAMSLKCPVIYTKRSCGPEIVKDGEEGLLVDPDNIEEIETKITLLLNDSVLRNELGEAGFRSVNTKFNIGKSAADHILFYAQVIENFKQGNRHVLK